MLLADVSAVLTKPFYMAFFFYNQISHISGVSRGFQTLAYRFGCQNYETKLKESLCKVIYLIVSFTQMRLHVTRHVI